MKFVHLSKTKIERFITPKKLGKSFKPKNTLWFACRNEWKEYVEYISIDWLKSYKYSYQAKLDLKSLIILKTKKDIQKFSEEFSVDKDYYEIDWDKVRTNTGKFGVYMVNPSIVTAREEYPWYSSFDICSVAIWDKQAILSMIESIYQSS